MNWEPVESYNGFAILKREVSGQFQFKVFAPNGFAFHNGEHSFIERSLARAKAHYTDVIRPCNCNDCKEGMTQ